MSMGVDKAAGSMLAEGLKPRLGLPIFFGCSQIERAIPLYERTGNDEILVFPVIWCSQDM